MINKDIRTLIASVPKNAKVCIWGAANAGISILELLQNIRKDVEISCFIDSGKTGEVYGYKIYKPENIDNIRNQFDFVIVSTRSDCTIIDAFLYYYDLNFVRISKNALKRLQFLPSKYNKVLDILESKEDKLLFRNLIEARITDNTEKIQNYVLKKHNLTKDRKRTIKHYTSYINYDAIEVILEGGMFNGLNTIIFKKLFKNLKKIYAFELIYDDVKNKTIAHIIDSMMELEIVKYAMWDKQEQLEFIENVNAPYSSGVTPTWNRNNSERKILVDAISIDEFVESRSLEKVDFIKMDIEGAELKALKGGSNSLVKFRPQLAISIYHSNNDMLDIPLYLNDLLKDYVFKIGQYSPDNDETILYAIPKELYNVREN